MPRKKKQQPPQSPEARESMLIDLAQSDVERRLREGTAPTQVLLYLLKLGSSMGELEKEKILHENALLGAKTTSIESTKGLEEKYENAMRAIAKYRGENYEIED